MDTTEYDHELSECIQRAIQEHFANRNSIPAWPQIDGFNHPILRVEAFLEEAGSDDGGRGRPGRIASVCTLDQPVVYAVCNRSNPLTLPRGH